MFAILRVSVSPQFLASRNAVFNKSFSSKKSSLAINGDDPKQSSTISYLIDTRWLASKDALSISKKSSSAVNDEDPERTFTIAYLTDACGLSFEEALSISKKVTIKSPENPDSVLKLLRKYGFTTANIQKLITRWPGVLKSSPNKTLLPKFDFFHSIGVPLEVLAEKLSSYPDILWRSLQNYHIPLYDSLKNLVQSDESVVKVFTRAPKVFSYSGRWEFPPSIAILRQRGIPESFIISMVIRQPRFLLTGTKRLTSCIDRAAEMGFDTSKYAFIHAIQLFAEISESTLERKKEIYRRWGWSESDISLAFMKYPHCMRLSEKKLMDNMSFLVNDVGLQPVTVSRYPLLLSLNLDRKMKPRYLVARVLKERGLLKKKYSAYYYFNLSEERFLKRYIVKYQEHVPELLDIYRGKLTVSDISQEVIFR